MMAINLSQNAGLDIRSRLQFSQPSQPTPSQFLNSAFSHCNLSSQSEDVPMSQDCVNLPICTQPDVCTQDYLCTPDYITPAEQQYNNESNPQDHNGKHIRSPLPISPSRIKRTRRTGSVLNPENQSQFSQPDRAANPASTSGMTPGAEWGGFAKPEDKPPQMQRGTVRRNKSPPTFRNLWLYGPEERPAGRVPQPQAARYRSDFKEESILGQGNFCKVYRATSRNGGREYAIKRSAQPMASDAEKLQWLQEVQAMEALDPHVNIVRYYTSWMEEDKRGSMYTYIQMERCATSLGIKMSVLKEAFKEAELVEILRQMASALQYLHSIGMVHMDVKPDNIYTTVDGNSYKLGDFGLAMLVKNHTAAGRLQEGDARYIPQEVLNDDLSRLDKADMFALGATVYELATGTPLPTGGKTYHDLRQGKLALLTSFTAPFQKMLKSLMSPDPAERPSAEKVLASPLLVKKAHKESPAYGGLVFQPSSRA